MQMQTAYRDCHVWKQLVISLKPTVTHIFHVEVLPCSHEQIRKWSRNDPVLSRVIRCTLDSWPSKLSEAEEELKPFFHRRNEITLEQGVLMWGVRGT